MFYTALFMQYGENKNHVLIDDDVIANHTHQDSHYTNCTIGIL